MSVQVTRKGLLEIVSHIKIVIIVIIVLILVGLVLVRVIVTPQPTLKDIAVIFERNRESILYIVDTFEAMEFNNITIHGVDEDYLHIAISGIPKLLLL